MVELISDLRADSVRANLAAVREEIATAVAAVGRTPGAVEVLAATKYVSVDDLPVLAEAGVGLVGENRAQDLAAKVAAHGEMFTWDFIGRLQSRKVKAIVPHVRLIHSVASDSVLRELAHHQADARPGMEILVEVNVAGEPGKDGVAPAELDAFIERSPVPVAGLMTMPPSTAEARGQPPLVRGAALSSRRAWLEATLDGNLPGLPRGGRGGRDNRADRHQTVRLRITARLRQSVA